MFALDSVLFEVVSNVDLVTLHSQVKDSQLRIEHTNTQRKERKRQRNL